MFRAKCSATGVMAKPVATASTIKIVNQRQAALVQALPFYFKALVFEMKFFEYTASHSQTTGVCVEFILLLLHVRQHCNTTNSAMQQTEQSKASAENGQNRRGHGVYDKWLMMGSLRAILCRQQSCCF